MTCAGSKPSGWALAESVGTKGASELPTLVD